MSANGNGTATKSNLLNLSALEMHFGIHRGTIKKRLDAAGIKQHKNSTPTEKLYLLTAAVEKAVRAPDEALQNEKLADIQIKRKINEAKLQKITGEVAPVQEFADITNQIFGTLYKKITLNMPSAIIKKVRAAKTDAEGAKIIGEYAKKIFNDLRDNHEKFLRDS